MSKFWHLTFMNSKSIQSFIHLCLPLPLPDPWAPRAAAYYTSLGVALQGWNPQQHPSHKTKRKCRDGQTCPARHGFSKSLFYLFIHLFIFLIWLLIHLSLIIYFLLSFFPWGMYDSPYLVYQGLPNFLPELQHNIIAGLL